MAVERRRRRRKSRGPLIFTFFIIIILAGGGFVALWGWLTTILVDVQPVERATLEELMAADFIVIRQEYKVSAPSPGRLELVVQEGAKVPKGAIVAYLTRTEGTSLEHTNRLPLLSPEAGVFSLHIDGLEGICNPQALAELNPRILLDTIQASEQNNIIAVNEGELVTSGQLLYKIVDNLSRSFLVCESERTLPEQFEMGAYIDLQLVDLATENIKGVIQDIYQESNKTYLVIKITTMNNLEKYRRIMGKIVLNRYSGFIVSEDVMIEKDGQPGVYLWEKGKVRWQEIEIIGQVEQQLAVTGLTDGQWLITTPKFVKDGQRVLRR